MPCTCKIQWIDEQGKPTPDSNEAIGRVMMREYVAQVNGRGIKIDASPWYPICATKKDYVAIAQALMDARPYRPRDNSTLDREANEVISTVARNLSEVMQLDNPRFDRARFLAACGVQS